MTGLKAVDTYHREALERAFLDLREELHDKSEELQLLKVRSEQAILDTARCAALISGVESIHSLLQRKKGGAKELASALLGEKEC